MKKAFFSLRHLFCCHRRFASITGSVSGTVKDTTGSVLPWSCGDGRNVDTGVATTTRTNRDGSYSFPDLPDWSL